MDSLTLQNERWTIGKKRKTIHEFDKNNNNNKTKAN